MPMVLAWSVYFIQQHTCKTLIFQQEQKLFDMGSSVADVARSLGPKAVQRLAESAIDPHELLWGILQTLSQIRGSPSYLFPSLLERCKTVLGLDCTITMGNFLPALGTEMPDQLQQLNSWAGQQGWNMLAPSAAEGSREMDADQTESATRLPPVSQGGDYGFHEYLSA